MGFKVLVRSPSKHFHQALDTVFEESALEALRPEDLDWADAGAVEQYCLEHKPCAVVNACLSDDGGEHPVVSSLVSACETCNLPLSHFSSYRVFGEPATSEFAEEGLVPEPSDDYGQHLLALENMVSRLPRHFIFRVSWMLGGQVENVFEAIIPKLVSRAALVVSDHHSGSPLTMTAAAHAVSAVTQQVLCGAENWGVFHLRSSDSCSEAELCDALVRILNADLGFDVAMPEVATGEDERRLLRGCALLEGDRVTRNFGVQRSSWRKGLKAMVKDYVENRSPSLKAPA